MIASHMSSFGDHYVLAPGQAGHERLRALCEIHDPHTRELLLQAGLRSGHHYVEFGCGLGYVSRWVAPRGAHVTAVDLSEEHLTEAQRLCSEDTHRDIKWVNANIYSPDLPASSFDFAYVRWVLIHLCRPVDALRSVFEVLRPGGIVVCEEPDLSLIYSEPISEAYDRYLKIAFMAGEKRGVDYAGGRRLHCWLREAGFEIERIDAYQKHYLTGAHKGFWSWSFIEGGTSLIADGLLTAEQLQELARGMRAADSDPSILVGHCRNHQVIARKP
jgi:ubiquinone/menaquinone biosynthesis C-methylase UbiE